MICFADSISSAIVRRVALLALFGASAVAPGQEVERMQVGGEVTKTYIVKLEAPRHKRSCQARMSIEYIQNNEIASVSGEIENEDCAASGGTYTMNVRFRDQNDQLHDLDFDETWNREDDQKIIVTKEYEIGRNVDLIRVKTQKMKCDCIESDDAVKVRNQKQE